MPDYSPPASANCDECCDSGPDECGATSCDCETAYFNTLPHDCAHFNTPQQFLLSAFGFNGPCDDFNGNWVLNWKTRCQWEASTGGIKVILIVADEACVVTGHFLFCGGITGQGYQGAFLFFQNMQTGCKACYHTDFGVAGKWSCSNPPTFFNNTFTSCPGCTTAPATLEVTPFVPYVDCCYPVPKDGPLPSSLFCTIQRVANADHIIEGTFEMPFNTATFAFQTVPLYMEKYNLVPPCERTIPFLSIKCPNSVIPPACWRFDASNLGYEPQTPAFCGCVEECTYYPHCIACVEAAPNTGCTAGPVSVNPLIFQYLNVRIRGGSLDPWFACGPLFGSFFPVTCEDTTAVVNFFITE